jgi:hypothetical protein
VTPVVLEAVFAEAVLPAEAAAAAPSTSADGRRDGAAITPPLIPILQWDIALSVVTTQATPVVPVIPEPVILPTQDCTRAY